MVIMIIKKIIKGKDAQMTDIWKAILNHLRCSIMSQPPKVLPTIPFNLFYTLFIYFICKYDFILKQYSHPFSISCDI